MASEQSFNATTNATQLPMVNLDGPKESLKQLKTTLEKCCKNGSFDLDEAFLNKLSLDHLANCVSALEQYQEYAVKQVDSQRKLAEARGEAITAHNKIAKDKSSDSSEIVQQIDEEADDLNDETIDNLIKRSSEEDTEQIPENESGSDTVITV